MISPPRPPLQGNFIETLEYRRFAEFCAACRKYQYIGLCYGAPGVGKTLSARHYARWDEFTQADIRDLPRKQVESLAEAKTAFYTVPVAAVPRTVAEGIAKHRGLLKDLALEPLRWEEDEAFLKARQEEEDDKRNYVRELGIWYDSGKNPNLHPKLIELHYGEISRAFGARRKLMRDPTELLIVDEADRLNMSSLDQVRDIFDRGKVGLVLIGMPGIEKRLARYAQFYSRIGFVHEYRTLTVSEVRQLLNESWAPEGVVLPALSDEILAIIVRITHGNFRLMSRLLTQVERILQINGLTEITGAVLEAARENLVIGQL